LRGDKFKNSVKKRVFMSKKNRTVPFEEYVPAMKRIISEFQYGQPYLLGKTLRIEVNRTQRIIRISEFYQEDPRTGVGVCHELAEAFAYKFRQEFPDFPGDILRMGGNDNVHFWPNWVDHTFNVITPRRVFGGPLGISDPSGKTSKSERKKWLLVDPSLGVIKPFEKSRYRVRVAFPEGGIAPLTRNRRLENLHTTPLCWSGDKIAWLGVNFDKDELFSIQFRAKGTTEEQLALNDPTLDSFCEDTLPYVELFRSAEIIETTRNLMVDKFTVRKELEEMVDKGGELPSVYFYD
jgi:hypothetical protein